MRHCSIAFSKKKIHQSSIVASLLTVSILLLSQYRAAMFSNFRERLAEEKELLVELGSDQTSCHNPFNGGYYPVGLSFDEANQMMATDKPRFEGLVRKR